MLLRFCKMYCQEQDYVIVELLTQHARIQSRHIQKWASRSKGIGFNRLLCIEIPETPEVDFICRAFTNNGFEVACEPADFCCAARMLLDKRLAAKKTLLLHSAGQTSQVRLQDDGLLVAVNLQTDEKSLAMQVRRIFEGQIKL